MDVQGDQMVHEYLCRLSQVAQGPLPRREWARLVEQIRRCIAAQRQPGARDDVDRVQRILRRMGDPDLIVGEAVRRLALVGMANPATGAGSRAESQGGAPGRDHAMVRHWAGASAGPPAAPHPAEGGATARRLRLEDAADVPAFAAPDRDDLDVPQPLLSLDVAPQPLLPLDDAPQPLLPQPLVLAAGPPDAEAETDLLNRLGACRRELIALLALTGGTLLLALIAGTPLLAHVGLVVGGVLVASSGLWVMRDKLLTMLALPLATLLGGVVLSWLQATRLDPAVQIGDRLERAGESLWATFLALPLIIGWTVALYLGFRLLRAVRD